MESKGDDSKYIYKWKERQQKMSLIGRIVSDENIREAIRKVKSNKGAPGVDGMTVDELDTYFDKHGKELIESILTRKYKPQPVKRIYIPKSDGKKRPLGIPTVVDRVIQQAIARVLTRIYDPHFSEYSYGFRPNRSAHMAINKTLEYLNEGNEWCVDIDIEKYFDTVNHDKLISILRERINDASTLHLIRKLLQAGVMEDGLVSPTILGVPQGGPLSPIITNVYLDKLDKELEARGLRFARYADDCNIYVKSEMSANRVIQSVTSWLERKLFLKVNARKTKVVRPTKSNFLGITYYKNSTKWKCKPMEARKRKLYDTCREVLTRSKAVGRSNSVTFKKINDIVRGWINYFRIGSMKTFMDTFGQWLRHKIRVIILKQWKKPKKIYKSLQPLKRKLPYQITDEQIYAVANSRLGWYKRANGKVVNFLLNPEILGMKKGDRPGLINPLEYYQSKNNL